MDKNVISAALIQCFTSERVYSLLQSTSFILVSTGYQSSVSNNLITLNMRTGRSLTICWGVCFPGGCMLPGGGCLLPRVPPSWGVQVRIQGGPRGLGPPLTLGFEAPKLSIFGPYLIFP